MINKLFTDRQWCMNALDEFEIQQDYKIRAKECLHPNGIQELDYHQIGGCMGISTMACDWFSDWHKLNEPYTKRCILLHKNGVQDKNGNRVEELGVIEPNMVCFTWKEGCIWKTTKDEFVYPKCGSKGAIHYVVMVTVTPGEKIIVDWSIGQFSKESIRDTLLFVPM